MVVHKLSLDFSTEIPFSLIAIHTSLEDYHLAYLINQQLPILLSKKEDIELPSRNGSLCFSRFFYENLEYDIVWDLFRNKSSTDLGIIDDSLSITSDLFEVSTTTYLLSEYKKVDYFLRVQNFEESVDSIISSLNNILRIETIYQIHEHQIKSKNNLIF